ncbi:MAG: hypothetical protein EOO77_31625, partial [Oxalobacteraceae bacterium]
MPRYQYTVLSKAVPGREEEFIAWYRDHHLNDVCRMPGVVSGKLFRMDFQRVYELDNAPQWTLMTIYELEGDDPALIIDSIRAASGSATMPASEALTKSGMIQAAGHLIASAEELSRNCDEADGTLNLAAREIPVPSFLSDIARAYLRPQPTTASYPELDDSTGWRAYVAATDQTVLPLLQRIGDQVRVNVEERDAGGARVFDILPPGVSPDSRVTVLDIHGGALILCGGELCRIMGTASAVRLQRRVWSVDYRMPPDHPYPAALDDCIA